MGWPGAAPRRPCAKRACRSAWQRAPWKPADGGCARAAPIRSPAAADDMQRGRGAHHRAGRRAGGGGRHRRRQDLLLPGAGAALGSACCCQHGHQDPAGPAVPARPAAAARGAGLPVRIGPAQGPRQLPLHAPAGPGAPRRQSCPIARRVRTLAKIEQWAQTTRTGDLAEMPGLDERSPVIPLVTSTRENCLGAQCPKFRACHVNKARREALAADVVVINHHLFFADLAVRESGMAELLPTVRVADLRRGAPAGRDRRAVPRRAARQRPVMDFARDLLGAGLQLARGLVDWQQLASASNAPRATCAWWWAGARARGALDRRSAGRSAAAQRLARAPGDAGQAPARGR